MAFNSNGQVSYLVLDSLADGSKYGLEIIEYISQKTGGNYIMKKPTLYSCLTRMEKKGLVSSSYWSDSELGGKRHYYSITNLGRKSLEELAIEFANASYDDLENSSVTTSVEYRQETTEEQPSSPIFLHQDNFFNMVKEEEPKPTPIIEEEEKSDTLENQIDFFTFQEEAPEQDEVSAESSEDIEKIEYYQSILEQDIKKDDARFLNENETLTLSEEEEIQNKLLYDTSNELKKYRKRKSFSENQIEMAVVYENAEDQEIQRARIEELKKSMLEARSNNYYSQEQAPEPAPVVNQFKNEEISFVKEEINLTDESVENVEDTQDDAIFITNPRLQENDIPVQKRITPPNIEVNVYDNNLPAPRRNSSLEPTYKDMMAKLFERKTEIKKEEPQKVTTVVRESENYTDLDSFVDYTTLKNYYRGHGIEFKEYHKSNVERRHNTNFLNFLASTFIFLLSGIASAVLFGIISGANCLQASSNFLFYTVPIMFLIYAVYSFIRFKVYPSKKANLKYNSIVQWAVFVIGTILVFVVNLISGMQFETMSTYLTPLLVPIFALLIAFPVHYYARKILYNRFGK